MLSELERLAAMVADPVRIREIGADQWPLAMIACGLMSSNAPERLAHNLQVYSLFVSKVNPAERQKALSQLARFITARKGDGWRALLPFAVAEPEAFISSTAALHVATLAQPSPETKLYGVAALVDNLMFNSDCNPAVLSAVLGLSDMRCLPLLEPLFSLPEDRLCRLIAGHSFSGNHLSYQWMLSLLKAHPMLHEQVTHALAAMAHNNEIVLDVVLPIPTWAYTQPTPQPLHGWSLPEYLARMLPVLSQHLSQQQLQLLRSAFASV